MKKTLSILLALAMIFAFCACGGEKQPQVDYSKKSEGVMTYAEYNNAALNAEVTVEVFVQAHQSWWSDNGKDKLTVYAQDPDGGYFIFEMACSEEDSKKCVPGTKIKVTGYKSAWSGEVEITDATFEFCSEGSGYIAEPVDVTSMLGTDGLINYQNQFVCFKGMQVTKAPMYKWDGSGKQGDDLYFDVSVDGKTSYTFTVESYLCDKNTDVYKAVEALKVGDKIDLEGFCYWYEGVQPHITSVTPSK